MPRQGKPTKSAAENPGLPSLTEQQCQQLILPLNLSGRQARIVTMILQDKNDKQIAHELGLSKHTVRTYLNRVFQRLTVTNRLGLLLRILSSALAVCPAAGCPYKV